MATFGMGSKKKGPEVLDGNAPFQRRLCRDLLSLLDNPGSTSDLILTAADGRPFRVHRVILVARCEFFSTMFASGFDDSATHELPLPEADPNALALLLRFIYGGVLESCEREVLKSAMQLADFLRLADATGELQRRLLGTVSKDTLVEDLLWAERNGYEDTIKVLVDLYVKKHASTAADAVADELAERGPKLLARLHKQLVLVQEHAAAAGLRW